MVVSSSTIASVRIWMTSDVRNVCLNITWQEPCLSLKSGLEICSGQSSASRRIPLALQLSLHAANDLHRPLVDLKKI